MSDVLSLTFPEELVEAIAVRVAELVLERLPASAAEEPWHLLDVEEAARRLGRSSRWLRERKEQVGYVRLDGGALAFQLQDLQAYAAERIVGGPSPLERAV